ncbi:MAG TPA: hypothetical protein VG895_05170 [Patescibacteria group bacterium]|nr:hypothetical protein [Patescibacteria group bacterium]
MTPEIPVDQKVVEHPSEIFSENLASAGIASTPQTPKATLNSNNQPITQNGTQSAKIQIPSDRNSLIQKAGGSINDAATWLARFFLRMLAKENANN